MNEILIFVLGLFLGMRHAFDADHIVAVNILLQKSKSVFESLKLAIFWGLGHTFTLFFVGVLIFLFNFTMMTENIFLTKISFDMKFYTSC